jgi:outer membrane immunogenic protein
MDWNAGLGMPLMQLKKYLLATALAGLGSAPTLAADIAARPYNKAPALAAVYDWTGFYIGVNAGVGIGRDRFQHDFRGAGSPYSFFVSPQGGFGGGQIGYNWQTGSIFGPIVFGLEADIQGAGMDDDRTVFSAFGGATTTRYSERLDWFGTARGRIGISKGPVLSYVTAGYAVGNVKTNVNEAVFGGTAAFSSDRMQSGWVVGSGVEAALGGNWTGKIEYLYLDLGNNTHANALFAAAPIKTEIRENIFRVGLNYRIGGAAYAPVVAANWTGFYLGGNWGSGTGRDRSSIDIPAAALIENFNLAPDGINGGVQAGYNWQTANWVFGLEADLQGSTQKDNKTCVVTCTPDAFAAYDATLPWFGTVRGRLGYSVGSTLLYATGGLAYGGIKTKITTKVFAGVPVTQSLSQTNAGWTMGAGIETPFTLLGLLGPNWTTKTEYLYVDLGSTSDSFIFGGAIPATSTRSVTEHIFRTGINYHFNTPVVAKY